MKYLIDTNIWIDYTKKDEEAVSFINSGKNFFVSDITYGEILQGVKNKTELKKLVILAENWKIIYTSKSVSKKAINLLKKYTLSHGLYMLDALIAATALENKLTLVTKNKKHFKFIPRLKLY